MLWFVIGLFVAGVVAFAIWDYRRKSAARAAASQARFEEIFEGRRSGSPPAESAPAVAPPPAAAPAPPAPPPVAAVPAADRFLGPAETTVYRLLKGEMPDHEVFANVVLASVVSASGSGSQREQQMRRLAQYRIDFVVCDRDMRVVAAVEIENAGGADAIGVRRFKADCLKAAGIRLMHVNAAALPTGEEIRAFVLGRPRS